MLSTCYRPLEDKSKFSSFQSGRHVANTRWVRCMSDDKEASVQVSRGAPQQAVPLELARGEGKDFHLFHH